MSNINTIEQATELTLGLLRELINPEMTEHMGVRLWDGTQWPDENPRPTTIVLKHPGALRSMLFPGTEVGLGEAYLYDDFDVEGDLEAVFALASNLAQDMSGIMQKLRTVHNVSRLPSTRRHRSVQRGPATLKGKRHSLERDRQAVTYHYDVSNDFYALWLDQHMVYSCAYFHSEDEDINTAQERKLDYICRKLRLRPGQRLLDIGCGWGGLVIFAAMHYGVDATGITLSQPQADLANARIAEAGLESRCRVDVRDYREITEPESYDALVSIGMFEHVGASLLPTYFNQALILLKSGGVFLNHGIAINALVRSRKGRTFSDAYVFPDGELTPISISLTAAEEAGFEVRDVESLREHYALTLRKWVSRLEAHHEQALQYVDEPTYRVWRLFMSASAYGFSSNRNNVYQALLVKPDEIGRSNLPLTRTDWYS